MALTRIVLPKRLAAEQNVLSSALLVTAIEDERKWREEEIRETSTDRAGEKIQWDAVDISKADKLVLSYSRLVRIENLADLTQLQRLRLDNNSIEMIEGLHSLVNLVELDLSFNKIRVIEGLGNLSRLTDLSLYANQITRIGGLEAQVDTLEMLSVGRNEITDQKCLMYLRKLRKLRILCMEGNYKGISQDEYRSAALALLPRLHYLDWTLVSDSERKAATETNHRLLSELRELIAAGDPDVVEVADAAASDSVSDPAHAAMMDRGMVRPGALGASVRGVADLNGGGGSGGSGADSLTTASANAVRDAGMQYVAYLWRIMMDPESVADISGLGAGAGATAAAARKKADAGGGAGGGAIPGSGSGVRTRAAEFDGDVVLRIPGVSERVESWREAVSALVEQAVSRGLASQADLTREIAAAEYVLTSYLQASDVQATALIDSFRRTRKQKLRELEEKSAGHEALLAAAAGARSGHAAGGGASAVGSLRAAATAAGEGGAQPPHHRGYHHGAHSHHRAGDGKDDAASENSELVLAEEAVAELQALLDHNDVLHQQLLGIETVLHEQCLSVLTEFDAAYAELAAKRNETFQKLFRAVEKESLAIADDCKTIVVAEVEAFQEHAAVMSALHSGGGGGGGGAAGGGSKMMDSRTSAAELRSGGSSLADAGPSGSEDDVAGGGSGGGGAGYRGNLDDDVSALLADREGSVVAVSNSFDQRIARVLAAEDKTRMSERERERLLVKSRLIRESERHRERMGEVNDLHARNKSELSALLLAEKQNLADLLGDA